MKYKKKPVEIEAVKLENDMLSMKTILDFFQTGKGCSIELVQGGLLIKTLEGIMLASFGDYIIRGVQGEFYPCKPDIFEQTYEEVDLVGKD